MVGFEALFYTYTMTKFVAMTTLWEGINHKNRGFENVT